MATITYIAERSLILGRTAGEQVSFEVRLRSADRSPRRVTEGAQSLSGRRMTRLMYRENRYSFQTPPFKNDAQKAQMIEFLDSVAGGEVFTVDVYGTPANPNNPINLKIQGDYTEQLVDITGFWRYSWQAVEV